MSSKKLSEKNSLPFGKRNRDGRPDKCGDDVIIIEASSSSSLDDDGLPDISCKKKVNQPAQSASASHMFATGRLGQAARSNLQTSDHVSGGQSHVRKSLSQEALSRSAGNAMSKQSRSNAYLSPDRALTHERMHHNWKSLASGSSSKSKGDRKARPTRPSSLSNQLVNPHSSNKEVSSGSINGSSRQAVQSPSSSSGEGSVKELAQLGHSRNWREKSNSDKVRKEEASRNPNWVKSSNGVRKREQKHLDKSSSSKEKRKSVVSSKHGPSPFLHTASAPKAKIPEQSVHNKFSTVTFGSRDRLEEREFRRCDAPRSLTDTQRVDYGYKPGETKVTPRSPEKSHVVHPVANATSKHAQNVAPLSSASLRHPLSPPPSATTLNSPQSTHLVATATLKHPLSPVSSAKSQHPPSARPVTNTPSPSPLSPADTTLTHPQTNSTLTPNITPEVESLSMVTFNENDLFEVLDSVETDSICSGYNNTDTESLGTASDGYCSKLTSEPDQPQLLNMVKPFTCRSPSESRVSDFTKSFVKKKFVKKKRQLARKSTVLNGAKFYKHPLTGGLLRLKRHCILRLKGVQYRKEHVRCAAVVKTSLPTKQAADQITPPVAKKVAMSNSNEMKKKRGNESKDSSMSAKRPKLSSDTHANKETQTPIKPPRPSVGKMKETNSDIPKKPATISTKCTAGGKQVPITSDVGMSTSDICSTTVQSVHSESKKCHHKEMMERRKIPKKKRPDLAGKRLNTQMANPLSTQPVDVLCSFSMSPEKPYPPTSPTRKPPPLILKKSKIVSKYVDEYCFPRSQSESELELCQRNRPSSVAVSNPNKPACPKSVDVKSGTSQSNYTKKAGVSLSNTQCVEQPHNRHSMVATVYTATKPTCPGTLGGESSKAGEALSAITTEVSCSASLTPQKGTASSVPVQPTKPAHSKKLDAQTKAESFTQENKRASSKSPAHAKESGAQAVMGQSNNTRGTGVVLLEGTMETSHTAGLTPEKKAASSEPVPTRTKPPPPKTVGVQSSTSQRIGLGITLPDGPSESKTQEKPLRLDSASQSSCTEEAGVALQDGPSEAHGTNMTPEKKTASCGPDTPALLATPQLPTSICDESRTVGQYLNDIYSSAQLENEPKVCREEMCNKPNSKAIFTPNDPAHHNTLGMESTTSQSSYTRGTGMALPDGPSEVFHSASLTQEKKSTYSEPSTPVSKKCLSLKRTRFRQTTSLSEAPTESNETSCLFGPSGAEVEASTISEKRVGKIVHIASHMVSESETHKNELLRPTFLNSKVDTQEREHNTGVSGSSALSETEYKSGTGCQERSISASCDDSVEMHAQRDEVYDLKLMETIAKLAPGSGGGTENTVATRYTLKCTCLSYGSLYVHVRCCAMCILWSCLCCGHVFPHMLSTSCQV